MSEELRQVAKGCHTRVLSYGTYDVNGYRFHTNKHEKERPNATTINSGLMTVGQDTKNGSVEYYGIIQEIIELTFQGKKTFDACIVQLSLVSPIPWSSTTGYLWFGGSCTWNSPTRF
jgi:hypothetical protein